MLKWAYGDLPWSLTLAIIALHVLAAFLVGLSMAGVVDTGFLWWLAVSPAFAIYLVKNRDHPSFNFLVLLWFGLTIAAILGQLDLDWGAFPSSATRTAAAD